MKGMIGFLDEMQLATRPRLDDGSSSGSSARLSRVPCKNSIDFDIGRCFERSVEGCRPDAGKGEKGEPLTPASAAPPAPATFMRPAKGFAAGDQRHTRQRRPFHHRGAHGGVRDRRRVRPFAAFSM